MGAAGLATSLAQVYSVNAVGYINLSIPVGFSMIANQLDKGAGNNTVANIFGATTPEGTTLYKYNGTSYDINTFEFGEWGTPAMTLNPGEGAFIKTGTAFTVTLVGEVPQGTLNNAIPTGFSIRSSIVPQSAALNTMGYVADEGDTVYRWANATGSYSIATYEFGEWPGGAAPAPAVGEAFFLKTSTAKTWTRTFSVNN